MSAQSPIRSSKVGFVTKSRPVFTNPIHLDVKPAARTSDPETGDRSLPFNIWLFSSVAIGGGPPTTDFLGFGFFEAAAGSRPTTSRSCRFTFGVNLVSNRADCAGFAGLDGS
jgi:hypothetical protein